VLVRQLVSAGAFVTGLDNLSFGGEGLLGVFGHPRFHFVRGDLRSSDDLARSLEGVDSVVHLAAIVGDPACSAEPELAREVNLDGSLGLYEMVRERASVTRFVFASTCSNYGRMKAGSHVDERSELAPLSIYAETKVEVERHLLAAAVGRAPVTTVLRFSTVYGISPRMRFDLTVNEFVREVFLGRELEIFGGQFWRPYCHVEDLARSCVRVLEVDSALVEGEVFGVGDTQENYQKRMIAEAILEQIPDARIRYVERKEDPRDYRVDFSKIRDLLEFKITKRVPDGIHEIHALLQDGILGDPNSSAYSNA
jgi:nucleoside-diphosphate-sugar epimerase